eukprot:scaffold26724_cov71-Phaeocystis_antarctica.AAC.3
MINCHCVKRSEAHGRTAQAFDHPTASATHLGFRPPDAPHHGRRHRASDTAVAVETLYTMYKACALDRQPCTASDSLHMLWVDLSKCFMTFSRAVGQLLQTSGGVPAQVRKAVWSLYSRPHGSFDWAFGCCTHFGSLRGSMQALLPTSPHPGLALQLFMFSHQFRYFIFQCKGHPNGTWSPWYSHRVGYRLVTDLARSPRIRRCDHMSRLWPLAMLHAASSDSAQAATTVPLSRHVARFLSLTQAQGPPAQADALKPHRQPFVWIPPAAQHHSIAYPHARALTQR